VYRSGLAMRRRRCCLGRRLRSGYPLHLCAGAGGRRFQRYAADEEWWLRAGAQAQNKGQGVISLDGSLLENLPRKQRRVEICSGVGAQQVQGRQKKLSIPQDRGPKFAAWL